jgi:hypothetical protein
MIRFVFTVRYRGEEKKVWTVAGVRVSDAGKVVLAARLPRIAARKDAGWASKTREFTGLRDNKKLNGVVREAVT